jgi:predicted transcriptional regulator
MTTTQQQLLDSLEDSKNFSMFSSAGNRRVKALIKKCLKKLFKTEMKVETYNDYVSKEVQKVSAQEKYREVGDTAVREVIYWWLEKGIEIEGYNWNYDFHYETYA